MPVPRSTGIRACVVLPSAILLLLALPLLAQKTHELCAPCHAEQVADFQSHPHFQKGLSCDACHGPSVKHRTSLGAPPPDRVAAPDEVPALCGGCHAAQARDYLASRHGKLVMARSKVKAANCVTCHGMHNPRAAAKICQRCHTEAPSADPHTLAAKSR